MIRFFTVLSVIVISLYPLKALPARNSSGTYTVSATGTYPFVYGTLISSVTVNSIFADLTTEMTDSLSRTGKGYMLSPLLLPAGSASLPALSFSIEPISGLWRAGTGDLRVSIAGAAARSGWTPNGFKLLDPASGASAYGITLQAPTLSVSYTLVFPTALPVADAPLIVKTDGTTTISKITAAYIEPKAVTATEIADKTVTAAQIADSTITSALIVDGTIVKADLANTALVTPAISTCTVNPYLSGRPFGYWKDVNGTVHLQGTISGCTAGATNAIYTMPGGFFTSLKDLGGAATCNAIPSVAASWTLSGTGVLSVITPTGQTTVSLDGVTYTP